MLGEFWVGCIIGDGIMCIQCCSMRRLNKTLPVVVRRKQASVRRYCVSSSHHSLSTVARPLVAHCFTFGGRFTACFIYIVAGISGQQFGGIVNCLCFIILSSFIITAASSESILFVDSPSLAAQHGEHVGLHRPAVRRPYRYCICACTWIVYYE